MHSTDRIRELEKLVELLEKTNARLLCYCYSKRDHFILKCVIYRHSYNKDVSSNVI